MVLFESNCIILHHNTSVKTLKTQNVCFNPSRASKITASENVCLFVNIRIETYSVYPDHTAPRGAVWSGSTLFVEEAFTMILVGVYLVWDKKHKNKQNILIKSLYSGLEYKECAFFVKEIYKKESFISIIWSIYNVLKYF